MDRMTTRIVAAIAAIGVACTATGCHQSGPAADLEAANQEATSVEVVDPGDFQNELDAAAAACPDLLTPQRISTSIEAFSGWRLGQVTSTGIRGLVQLPDDQFATHAPPGSDPDDPRAAITAIAGRMCEVGTELTAPFDRGQLQLQDWASTGEDLDRTAEFVALVVAGVMAGPQYVIDNGGASVRDPDLSDAMIRVMYA